VVEVGRSWPPLSLWMIGALAAAVVASLVLYPPQPSAEGGRLDGFRLGGAIFIGTFLLGTNYNYRLAFLLFALPQLVAWLREAAPLRRLAAGIALAALLFSLWSPFGEAYLPQLRFWRDLYVVADELANWCLFGVILALLFRTLPAWLQPAVLFRVGQIPPAKVTVNL